MDDRQKFILALLALLLAGGAFVATLPNGEKVAVDLNALGVRYINDSTAVATFEHGGKSYDVFQLQFLNPIKNGSDGPTFGDYPALNCSMDILESRVCFILTPKLNVSINQSVSFAGRVLSQKGEGNVGFAGLYVWDTRTEKYSEPIYALRTQAVKDENGTTQNFTERIITKYRNASRNVEGWYPYVPSDFIEGKPLILSAEFTRQHPTIKADLSIKIGSFMPAKFAWWDVNWIYFDRYCTAMNYNAPAITLNQTDFPACFNISTTDASKYAATCTNLRFIEDDNSTVMDYDYVSGCGTTATIFCQRIRSQGNSTCFGVYSGNTGAASGQNKTGVYRPGQIVGAYHMTNASNLVDSAGYNNLTPWSVGAGKCTNSSINPPPIGSAVNSSGDCAWSTAAAPNPGFPKGTNPSYSECGWIYYVGASVNGYDLFWSIGSGVSARSAHGPTYASNGQYTFSPNENNKATGIASGQNDWRFICMVLNGSATDGKLYINGTWRATVTGAGGAPNGAVNFSLGAGSFDNNYWAHGLYGRQFIINRTITPNESMALFALTYTLNASQQVAYTITIRSMGTVPTGTASHLQNLTCWVNISNDFPSYSVAGNWSKNGAVQNIQFSATGVQNNTNTTVATLLSGNLSGGDNWSCNAQATNGSTVSSLNSSANVTITNNVPTNLTAIAFINSTAGHSFSANATAFDADGGADINSWNYTISVGTCVNSSNSTGAFNRTVVLNCSSTSPGTAALNLTFIDKGAGSNSTNSTNAYPDRPSNLTPPVISGTPSAGNTLTCGIGSFADADGDTEATASRTFNWLNGSTPIAGQISSTFVVPAGYVGVSIKCQENATNSTWPNSLASNFSAPTIVNSNPVNVTISSFVNYSASHQFNVSAYGDDADGAADLTRWNWSISSGSCINASNSTLGNRRLINLTCTATSPATPTINITFIDLSGSYNNTSGTSGYPDHAPSLTAPFVTSATPYASDSLTCNAGNYSDPDSDTENISARTWAWRRNGAVVANATAQVFNYTGYSTGDKISCQETATNSTWPANVTTNSSNVTIAESIIQNLAYIIRPISMTQQNVPIFRQTNSSAFINITAHVQTTISVSLSVVTTGYNLKCAIGYNLTGALNITGVTQNYIIPANSTTGLWCWGDFNRPIARWANATLSVRVV